ncbi:MAG: FGGY-family carbohydrate kinase, partial [Geminicoccaceae bacterium]
MAIAGRRSPPATAVLDVGKSNVKLVAVGRSGRVLSSRSAPNQGRSGEPYPHCDVLHIWRWLM